MARSSYHLHTRISLPVLLSVFCIANATDPICINGLFEDWDSVPVAYSDPVQDHYQRDFAELRLTHDQNFLYLLLSYHAGDFLIQEDNDMRLYIDTDNDPSTGYSVSGIGAELEWCFGCRSGAAYVSTTETIYQADITLRIAPTITARRFEFALARNSVPFTEISSAPADTIRVVWKETSSGGDVLPDDPGGVIYVLDENTVPPPVPIPIEKQNSEDIRIVTYNVLSSGPTDTVRQEYFQQILTALNPDVWALQEYYDDPEAMLDLVQNWLPEESWVRSNFPHGNGIITRYSIAGEAVLTNSQRTMAVLLDSVGDWDEKLLIINSHFACCSANESRQIDVDNLTGVWRDWRSGTGWEPFPLEPETPMVHVGDFNFVGDRQQLITLVQGDIVDEITFGDDASPDWDNSNITDLFSRHTHIRMGYTWRNDYSSYNPGKLDYVLYTDSVLDTIKHFVFNTLAIPDSTLLPYGLEDDDTNLASDHLPRVVDLRLKVFGGTEPSQPIPHKFHLGNPYPNPFNAGVTIPVVFSGAGVLRWQLLDIRGQSIKSGLLNFSGEDHQKIRLDLSHQASGIYFFTGRSDDKSATLKLLLLK